MGQFTLTFLRDRETKNTIRFAEQPQAGTPPVIGTLYVQRWAAGQADSVHMVLTTEGGESPGPTRKV